MPQHIEDELRERMRQARESMPPPAVQGAVMIGETRHGQTAIKVPNLEDPSYDHSTMPFVLWSLVCLRRDCGSGHDEWAAMDRQPQVFCEHKMLMNATIHCPTCRNQLVVRAQAWAADIRPHGDIQPLRCPHCGWDSERAMRVLLASA